VKILILNHEFPPLGGGAGRASYYIGKELVKMGESVDVLTTSNGLLPDFEIMDGINVYRIYGRRRSTLDNNVIITTCSFLVIGTLKALRLLKRNRHDVIFSFFSIPAGVVGVILRFLFRIPVIVSLRGSDVPFYNPDEFRLQILALRPLIKLIWQRSSRVVALSEGLRNTARKTLPKFRYDIIHNGVDIELFRPMGTRSLSDKNGVRLITVSRLVERKGIQYLFRALAELCSEMADNPKLKLLVVGEGNYRSKLEHLRNKLNLERIVEFYGFCPNEKLPELYNQADVFVLPSLTESFGQVFGEAMACGLPIIGTNVGGIPEIVIDNENGLLIQPGDVAGLKTALVLLINNERLRHAMREKNVGRIKKHFEWAAAAAKYREIYKGLVCH